MLAILAAKDVEGETFNIGAGNEKSVLEITALILDRLKKPQSLIRHVTDRPEVVEGDEAVLFGDEPTAWDLADRAGTNAWEILTRVGARVPRVYVEGGRVVGVESRYSPPLVPERV